jgi:flagellar basal body-associated protein FliL
MGAYVPPPQPPAAGKSSSAWVVIAIALVLVLGGGAAAAIVGFRMYNNWKAKSAGLIASTDTSTPATNSAAAVTPSSNATTSTPPDGVLLSNQQAVPSNSSSTPLNTTPSNTSPSNTPTNVAQATVPPSASSSNNTRPVQIAQNMPRSSNSGSPAVAQQRDEPRPARHLSGVALAVTGDPNLVSSVSDVIESELRSAGVRHANAESIPATEGLVRGGDAATSRLISHLRDQGYAVLLLARVDAAGERELRYMGRRDTAFTSKVTLTTYDLASGRPFGSPARGTIEYTSVNQDKKTEEVVGRLARGTVEEIQNH